VQLALVCGRSFAADDRVNLDQPPFTVRGGWARAGHPLSKAKERQDSDYDHDGSDDPNDVVHGHLPSARVQRERHYQVQLQNQRERQARAPDYRGEEPRASGIDGPLKQKPDWR
jgi:hypothetical protein